MSENRVNLEEFHMSDAELFAPVNHDELESEKITAPRYSYWHSVFRVFFRKKINIIVLSILAVLLIFTYVYPIASGYDAKVDPFINVNDSSSKHLNPQQALDAPRWQWVGGRKVQVEQGVSMEIVEELRRRGHEVEIITNPIKMGRGEIILRDRESGVLCGAAESRCDGTVACI